jgi:formylglycine-generating enzyme required for sulfatase activity
LFEKYPYPDDPEQREKRELLAAPNDKARVLRGGAFISIDWYVRCAFRDWYIPYYRYFGVGFRVVVRPLL